MLVVLLTCVFSVCASEWWQSKWAPTTSLPALNITVCTQVTYGTPYMFEWIEYHALMGVSKFIIYDAGSKGEAALLGSLYEKRKGPHVTIVKAANDQTTNFRRCVSEHRHETDWFAIFDSDEFFVFPESSSILHTCHTCACDSNRSALSELHSPRTLDLFLRSVPASVGRLYVRAVRFGANGWSTPSPYKVAKTKKGHAYLTPNVTQLVTEIHTRRGPQNVLDGSNSWGRQRFSHKFREMCNETASEIKDITQRVCGHGLGKSLVRAGFAWTIPDEANPSDVGRFIHRFPTFPDRPPFLDVVPMSVLRLHHYSLRNFAEASPGRVWKHLAISKARRVKADAFFNTIPDHNATCYAQQLRRRLASLQAVAD